MSIKRIIITILLAFSALLAIGSVAYADTGFDINKGIVGNLSEACREQGDCGWCDFIDLFIILQKTIFYLFGGLALAAMVWGGQKIILAAGNEEKVSAGKKIITSTLFGVLTILGAYMLVNIILMVLTKPTGNASTVGALFTQNWQLASCDVKSQDSDAVVDKDKACKEALSGATCKNINACSKKEDIQGKYSECVDNNKCIKGKCEGDKTIVCCI